MHRLQLSGEFAPVLMEERLPETWLLERSRILSLSFDQVERIAAAVLRPDHPVAFAFTAGMGSAQGRAVVIDDWVGIFDMLTEPSARGRGLGRSVLASLLAWGAVQGAERAFLQVEVGNEPAMALYSAGGFELAYRYSYRRAGGESQPR